jgi:hypothetical protein
MKGCEGEKGGAYQMSFFAMPLLCEDVIVRDIFRCKGRLICTVQKCYQGKCWTVIRVEKSPSGRCFTAQNQTRRLIIDDSRANRTTSLALTSAISSVTVSTTDAASAVL